jgi:putative membrane protein
LCLVMPGGVSHRAACKMEEKSGGTIKRFLQGWAINTLAVLVACLLPGISYGNDVRVLLLASLLLGVFNAVVRPLLMLVALPLLIVTLGLFMLVINALLLLLVGRIVHGFTVETFWWAVLGSIIISAVSLVMNTLTGTGKSRIHVRRSGPRRRPPDDGNGPIIDV